MGKKCCVCGDVKNTTDNVLYTCQGGGCDVLVHQACYGIVTPPTGLWFCRKCESQERAARVRCELCPQKEGALKRTDSGGWAHVVCALYIPEATFGNNERMEPIVTSKLPKERFSKPCYICEEKGMETQAMHGACMSCHKSSCRLSFHVTCAQREHLLCEDEDSRDPRSILYCGYCSQHFKKMERQKYKQLRKASVNPPSGSMPPLTSPLSDISPTTSQPLMIAPHPYTLSDSGHVIGAGMEGELGITDRLVAVRVKKEKLGSLTDPLSQKRSLDSPQLPPKKKRRRKVSSSNESNTSESLSYVSEPVISHGDQGSKEPAGDVNHDGLPLSPCAQVSSGNVMRQPSSSTSSEQSLASRSQAPPRSLQDLLERQWEQTAQFILDKVGKQNNVGSMLAHLHTLQSENRQMQSKIMELASQREFYIAINTKLRNSIAEQESHLHVNGLRDENQHMETASTQASAQRPRANKRSSNKPRNRPHTDTNPSNESTPQPKDPDSMQRIGPGFTDENSAYREGKASETSRKNTFSKSTKRAFQAMVPQSSENPESMHEITRVTNSVQAPISAFTPLPREGEGIKTSSGVENVR